MITAIRSICALMISGVVIANSAQAAFPCSTCASVPLPFRATCLMTCGASSGGGSSFGSHHTVHVDGNIDHTVHLGDDVKSELSTWSGKTKDFQNSIDELSKVISGSTNGIGTKIDAIGKTGTDLVAVGREGVTVGKDGIVVAKEALGLGKDLNTNLQGGIDVAKGFQPLLADFNKQLEGIQQVFTPENMFKIGALTAAGAVIGATTMEMGVNLVVSGAKAFVDWIHELITNEKEKSTLRAAATQASKEYDKIKEMRDRVLNQAQATLTQLRLNMALEDKYKEGSDVFGNLIEIDRNILEAESERAKFIKDKECFAYWSQRLNDYKALKDLAPPLNAALAKFKDKSSLRDRYAQICSKLMDNVQKLYVMEHSLQEMRLNIIQAHYVTLEDMDKRALELIMRSRRGVGFRGDAIESLRAVSRAAIGAGQSKGEAWGMSDSNLLHQQELAEIMRREPQAQGPHLATFARGRQAFDDRTRDLIYDQICLFDASRCQTLKYPSGVPVRDTRMESLKFASDLSDLCDTPYRGGSPILSNEDGSEYRRRPAYMDEDEATLYLEHVAEKNPNVLYGDPIKRMQTEAEVRSKALLSKRTLAGRRLMVKSSELARQVSKGRAGDPQRRSQLSQEVQQLELEVATSAREYQYSHAMQRFYDSLEWQRMYELEKEAVRKNPQDPGKRIFLVNYAYQAIKARVEMVEKMTAASQDLNVFFQGKLQEVDQLLLLYPNGDPQRAALEKRKAEYEVKLAELGADIRGLRQKQSSLAEQMKELAAWAQSEKK